MIDINLLRNDFKLVKTKLSNRNYDIKTLDWIIELDECNRKLMVELETLNAQRNKLSKTIGLLKKNKADDEVKKVLHQVANIKTKIEKIEVACNDGTQQLNEMLSVIPNLCHDSVKIGKDESENIEVSRHLTPRVFTFKPLAHWDLALKTKLYDQVKAAKITGSRFIIYTGQGARLFRALQQFTLDANVASGCLEILPQAIVNKDSLYGTGQLPKFVDDAFKLENSNYYLSPTAEVQLTNMYRDQIINGSELPIYLTANTPCFRSEAGSAGRDTRGVIRQHQFWKSEIVKIVKPEHSYDELEKLVDQASSILEALNLPYRKLLLCTGDTGFSSAKTYDIEVWLPSYNDYKEISSCSNCETFQARRAKIRFKETVDAKTQLVHTLNGSSLAIDRLWAAVVENYQNADGSITVPEKLIPYMGNVKVIK